MEVVICDSTPELGSRAADIVAKLVHHTTNPVLGLATGSSPEPLYDELARRTKDGALSLASCTAFMLDEYVGLDASHPQRYRNVIQRDVVDRTDLDPDGVHGPDGLADDLIAAAHDYEDAISQAGGIDLQVLGTGTDGHIGFNEPGSSLASRTRIKTLTDQTRRDNARFFDDDLERVPRHCLTQGIATIMHARHLLLLVSGKAKAEAIHHIIEGPISAMWPGTILQMHPHVTVLLDTAAASRLQLAPYYNEALAYKPAWQGY